MRRALVRIAWALAILLATVPATAQGAGLTATATVQDGALEIDLRGPATGKVLVAITHDDPLLGPIVDRVVEANVSADGERLVVDNLRFGANFTVRVFDRGVELPSLPNVSRVIDGARLRDVGSLLDIDVPAILPASGEHARAFRSYPIVGPSDFRSVVATREGALVVAELGRDANGTEWLSAWRSLDGGHTYDGPYRVVSFPTENRNWAFAEIGGGDVAFLTRAYNRTAWGAGEELDVEPWKLTRFDPIAGSVAASVPVGQDGRTRLGVGNYEFAFLPGGDVLVAFTGGSEQRDAHGNVVRAHSFGDGVQVWRISQNGSISFVALLPSPGATGTSWRIAVSQTGAVAIVMPRWLGGSFATGIAYTVAPDGKTFGAWHQHTLGHPEDDWGFFIDDAEVDATGALLVAVSGARFENGSSVEDDATLLRFATPGAPPTTLDLSDATRRPAGRGAAQPRDPSVVMNGMRAWAFWTDAGELWSIESLTGGATYGAPTRLYEAGVPPKYVFPGENTAAILPDGRPVLVMWSNGQLVSAPLFDPMPDDSLLARLMPATPITLHAELVGAAPVLIPGREATLTLRLRIDGPSAVGAVAEIVDPSGTIVPRAANVTIGNTAMEVTIPLRAAATLEATASATARNVSFTVLVTAPGAPQRALAAHARLDPAPLAITAERASLTLAPGETAVVGLRIRGMAGLSYELDVEASGLRATADPRQSATDANGDGGAVLRLEAPSDAGSARVDVRILARLAGLRASFPIQVRVDIVAPVVDTPVQENPAPVLDPVVDAPPPSTTPTREVPAPESAAEPSESGTPATPAERAPDSPGADPAPDAGAPAPAPATVAITAGSSIAVVTVVAVAAATEAGRTALLLGAAALYSRLRRAQVLDHARRNAVFHAVQGSPGVRFEELRRATGISAGALAFHLRVLEREGYLVTRIDGARRRIYPSGLAPPSVETRAVADRIMDVVRERPGIGQAEVAHALGMSRQLAAYHLDAIAKRGRVHVVREGKQVRYHPVSGVGAVVFEPVA